MSSADTPSPARDESGLHRLEAWRPLRRAGLPPRPRTRFAPSVTGVLHVGHVLNAIVTWGVARALGGSVVLRLEDHDRSRWRREHERSILDDIDWLGLVPDEGPTAELRAGTSPYRQSDSDSAYLSALESLRERGRVFACDCTRRSIASEAAPAPGSEPAYRGRCRDRRLADGGGRGLRVVMEPGEERFDDVVLGPQAQDPARQCGDVLVRDRQGQWTYHFAVVVDDARHGIDLVVRGRDLLDSTGRQLRLHRLLDDGTRPAFLHHPLIGDAEGRKLSKRHGAAGVSALREQGRAPADVLGLVAWLGGLQEGPSPVGADDLGALLEPWLV